MDNNPETKICHLTLGVEVTDDDKIVAYGAPCMKEKCMAWVPPQTYKYTELGSVLMGTETKEYAVTKDGYCKLLEVKHAEKQN